MTAYQEHGRLQVLSSGGRGTHWGLHVLAVLLCICFAASVWVRTGTVPIEGDKANIVQMVLARDFPQHFARDPFFGGPAPDWYPPLCRAAVRWLTANFGVAGGHRVAQFPLLLAYLWVMYGVLYVITRSVPAALLVAWLSVDRLNSLGGSYWGMDTMETVQPRSFVLIFTPWLLLLSWRLRTSRWVVAPFFLGGLLMNVNPPGALFFVGLLGLSMLLTCRSSGCRIRHLLAAGVAVAVGAAPFVYGHLAARVVSPVTASPYDPEVLMEALQCTHAGTFALPVSGPHMHYFLISFGPALLLAVPGWILRGPKRSSFDRWMLCFFLLALIGPVAAQYAVQKIFTSVGKPPPIANVMRAQKYAYLILHIYTAFFFVELLARARRWDRYALIAAAAAVLLAQAPLHPPGIAWSFGEMKTLLRGQKISGVPPHLGNIAAQVRVKTPPDSLFLFADPQMAPFRIYALRSLAFSLTDGGMAFYAGPARLIQWYRWRNTLFEAIDTKSTKKLLQLADETGADYVGIKRGWPTPPRWIPVYSDPYWALYARPPIRLRRNRHDSLVPQADGARLTGWSGQAGRTHAGTSAFPWSRPAR